jgi:hypothetical protein
MKKENHRSAGREGVMLTFSENLKNENYYSTTNVISDGASVFDADFLPM